MELAVIGHNKLGTVLQLSDMEDIVVEDTMDHNQGKLVDKLEERSRLVEATGQVEATKILIVGMIYRLKCF